MGIDRVTISVNKIFWCMQNLQEISICNAAVGWSNDIEYFKVKKIQ